ncbi:hypothetical protein [Kamptonema formosum]|uniref:hypothetical protein n=1 Tax=Kamptonema formosum TaxID=331992 RepID=UPI0003455529|nr:hypothetical protein [Oscillatoria sp. PCC 10802]
MLALRTIGNFFERGGVPLCGERYELTAESACRPPAGRCRHGDIGHEAPVLPALLRK